MAFVKSIIKGASTVVGEILVIGGALGTAYVLGFIKGGEIKPKVEKTIDDVTEVIKTKAKNEEEPVTEENSEPESENEEVRPSIKITHNYQAED